MKITDSVKIKNITTKNRIAVPPMVMFHWSDENGFVTEKHIAHYDEIAKGHPGLVIVEATAINKNARLHQTELGLWEDAQIEGFKKITENFHREGVPCFIQIVNAGINGDHDDVLCPSDMEIKRGDFVLHGHEMTQKQIDDAVRDFAECALRAKKAGFDGVELHGCHGYLISQFYSPVANTRTDEYGKDKGKFCREVLKAVRDAVGENFIVGIRLAAFEPDLAAGIEHAKDIASLCDFMDISYGYGDGMIATKPDDFPYKEAFYGAGEIKKVLPDMPVFAVDNVKNGDDIQGILDLTGIDMVDCGRAHLVNPNFSDDVIAGRPCGKCVNCKPACHYSPFMNDGVVDCAGRKMMARE